MADFVQGPAVRVSCNDRFLDLLLVTFGRWPFHTIGQELLLSSSISLPRVGSGHVDWSRVTFDTVVLEARRQVLTIVLWVIAKTVIPLVTVIACDSVAIIVVVPAEATDLAVVLLRAVYMRRAMTVSLRERKAIRDRSVSRVVPVDNRGRIEIVCHAIAPVEERVVGDFM